MSILTAASVESCWRGYEYFEDGRVAGLEEVGDGRFRANVSGNGSAPYKVEIDIDHPRKSSCSCPHAAGRRIVCKHMVATYFAAFPQEAQHYYDELLRAEDEWEEELEKRADSMVKYVRSLKKREAQDRLLEVLQMGPEWLWDRFFQDYVK